MNGTDNRKGLAMRNLTTTKLALLAALALAAAAPAAASAKTIHFEGHAVDPKHDDDMTIAFDVRAGQGRPQSIANVTVTALDYSCVFGGDTERDVRLLSGSAFDRSFRFDIAEHQLPPAYKNDAYGRFAYPKKGVRSRPTVTGWISSEFGYGETRSTYNCLGIEQFRATPKR